MTPDRWIGVLCGLVCTILEEQQVGGSEEPLSRLSVAYRSSFDDFMVRIRLGDSLVDQPALDVVVSHARLREASDPVQAAREILRARIFYWLQGVRRG